MMMRDIGLSFTMKCEINLWRITNLFFTQIFIIAKLLKIYENFTGINNWNKCLLIIYLNGSCK